MTIPLLVNSKGDKFGKSTGGGCLWLDSQKTTPYALYQFILNVQDDELENLLLRLTFTSEEEIARTLLIHKTNPEARVGQKFLASALIRMVHGEEALKLVEQSTSAFF